jgi:hypothetical protein
MPRLNRRRVISVRLSNEEYDQLQDLCLARGADSISELARTGMKLLMLNQKSNGHAAVEDRVNAIYARVSLLDREIARLSNMIGLERLALDKHLALDAGAAYEESR